MGTPNTQQLAPMWLARSSQGSDPSFAIERDVPESDGEAVIFLRHAGVVLRDSLGTGPADGWAAEQSGPLAGARLAQKTSYPW